MAEDLSQQHAPISDLFPQPATPADWDQYRLSDEQLTFYEENGHVAGAQVLNDDPIDELSESLNVRFTLHPRRTNSTAQSFATGRP